MADTEPSQPAVTDSDAPVEQSTAAPVADTVDLTDEGRTATALDAALQLRLDAGIKLSNAQETRADSVEQLGSLLQTAVERYGQMANVCAPIYHAYGRALLRAYEDNADALGQKAPGGEDGADSDSDGEEAGEGEGEAAAASAPAEAGEEDLTGDDKEKEDDDLEIAYESLDVARVLYERMGPEHELDLAKVRLCLGDCEKEGAKFAAAKEEYLEAFKLRARKLKADNPNLADPLIQLMYVYISMSNEKDVSDEERKGHLKEAYKMCVAAAEVLVKAAMSAGAATGNTQLVQAIKSEVAASALRKTYPKGVPVTTAVGVSAPASGVGAGAGAGAGAGEAGLGSAQQGDVDIRIFKTIYEQYSASAGVPDPTHTNPAASAAAAAENAAAAGGADAQTGTAPATAAPVASGQKLLELCEDIDDLIARSNDIMDDLGVSVRAIVAEVHGDTGTGASASAASTTTSGFDKPTATSSTAAVTMVARRAPAPAAASASESVATSDPASAPSAPSAQGKRSHEQVEGQQEAEDGQAAKRTRTEA